MAWQTGEDRCTLMVQGPPCARRAFHQSFRSEIKLGRLLLRLFLSYLQQHRTALKPGL